MISLTPKPSQKITKYLKVIYGPNLNSLYYAIWGILENKTNATAHPNIGSLKTGIEKERNKMTEDIIMKACKSFQKRVGKIPEKKKLVNLQICLHTYFVVFFIWNNLVL